LNRPRPKDGCEAPTAVLRPRRARVVRLGCGGGLLAGCPGERRRPAPACRQQHARCRRSRHGRGGGAVSRPCCDAAGGGRSRILAARLVGLLALIVWVPWAVSSCRPCRKGPSRRAAASLQQLQQQCAKQPPLQAAAGCGVWGVRRLSRVCAVAVCRSLRGSVQPFIQLMHRAAA
jgi:hypothetical protein